MQGIRLSAPVRLVIAFAAMAACTSSSDPAGSQGGGGMPGGQAGGAAGAAGIAGQKSGGNGGAGGATGGAAGSTAGMGGQPRGDAGVTLQDAAVAATDAAASKPGDAAAVAAVPSAGCGKATRPASGEITVDQQYVLTFPPDYDGKTPAPVVFGFHGANRTHIDFRNADAVTRGTDFERRYVMAYVKSVGNDWTSQFDANFARFDAVYNALSTTHCIDTARVFAIGHSSGAQFISRLVCKPEARLRAVAPVASSPTNGTCRAIPVLVIQGKMDTQRGGMDASSYVSQFVMRNGCAAGAAPLDIGTCMSRQNNVLVHPGCVEYPGCGKNPTVWCSHDDPFYSDTMHGWPCFANRAILDFFAQFP